VGYLLRPHWPTAIAPADGPPLPIVIGGVPFNVPAAAIRFAPQRRPGVQPRLDLAYQWPRLTPPERGAKPTLSAGANAVDHLLVSIAAPEGALSLEQRTRTVYPRYLAPQAFEGPNGLSGVAFRDGTPYQGEDLLFDLDRPQHFFARCTRTAGAAPGTCLLERTIGGAEVTARFPRGWLEQWPQLAEGLDSLLNRLQSGS
jgi:hypothetical protein